MEIKVLQGLNLESEITTIKATLDATPKTEHIDLVKSFHPIFLDNYSVEGNTVSVRSKLPNIWKEILKGLNSYALGDWSEQTTREYILDNVIRKTVKSMSTIPILHYALEAGYEVTPYYLEDGLFEIPGSLKYNRYYLIGCGQESNTAISSATSKDSGIAFFVQRDKWLTNTTIQRLKLPMAKWEVIHSEDHIREIFASYQKPVVIKPVGLTGGNGVTTKINTLEEAFSAYNNALEIIDSKDRQAWQRKIMIQEQVPGEDYRILVIGGKMRIATKRIPAFVTGDGTKTIEELINETNKDPRRNVSDPTHILKPIKFDEPLTQYLEDQNLQLSYVPKKDEKVFVRKVASMSQGGITEDFTDRVHPQIKNIVESLAASIHAFVLGVDVICEDLSKPLTKENGSIIECNTMPEAYLNAFPVIGNQYPDIGKWVVEGLVDSNNPTKKVVYVGKDLRKLTAYLKMNLANYDKEKIGMLSEKSIYINEELISSDIETWKAVEALKVNASLSTIALHYSSMDEVKNNGLGFNKIDVLLVDEGMDTEIFGGYQNLGFINKVEAI